MTRRLCSLAALIAALSSLAHAGITITSPKAGATLKAGTALTVQWTTDSSAPAIADLTTYTLLLVAGGNQDNQQQAIGPPISVPQAFTTGTTASAVIQPGASDDLGKVNAYFVKMVALSSKGGEYHVYSDRFSYSGFTAKGIITPAVKSAVADVSDTKGPPTVDTTGKNAATTTGPVDPDVFNVQYTMQTGLTRYAPMQPVPPKKITETNTKPLYPTSSVVIAKSRLPIPSVQTTLTASQTYSVSSMENTVAAAPHATDDMAKFLRRWQD